MRLALLHSGEHFPYEKPFFEIADAVKVFYVGGCVGNLDKLSVELYDGYVFTGGSDVTPRMYGEAPERRSVWDFPRDQIESAVFQIAYRNDRPMIGICRGFQFLAVMTGNKLHQHIEGHQSRHEVETDQVLTDKDHDSFEVNSLHHQAVAGVGPQGRILIRSKPDHFIEGGCWGPVDHETIFGVQYHPELMNPKTTAYKWFLRHTERALYSANNNQQKAGQES